MDIKINIVSTETIINTNIQSLKIQLAEGLKQYDLIVDEDSVKTAKAKATELNKLSKLIDDTKKEEVAKLSAPINELTTQMNELKTLCQESRQNLLSQVKVFDDKQVKKCLDLLEEELRTTYIKYGVKDEFQTATIKDLAIISNLNKTGIAKKAIVAIEERVIELKRFQEKIDTRLLTLETICYQGGLLVPLTRENINHFLKDSDDEVYLHKLVSLIENEINRLDKANKLKKVKEEIPNKTVVTKVTKKESSSPYGHFKNASAFKIKSNMKKYRVTAIFEIEVRESMFSKLKDMLTQKFIKTGFKNIPEILVEEMKIKHTA